MVLPQGFWLASSPVDDPDGALFAQHNMNRTLMQKGTTSFLLGVLNKHGVTGYEETLGLFRRYNAAGVIENLPVIIVGMDADKPDEDAVNNNAWYYAIDTTEFSVIHNGMRRIVGSSGFHIHNDVAIEMVGISGDDRLVVSDESATGDRNEWLSLNRFLDWIEDMISISADAVTNGRFSFNRMPQNIPRLYVTNNDSRPSEVEDGDFWAVEDV